MKAIKAIARCVLGFSVGAVAAILSWKATYYFGYLIEGPSEMPTAAPAVIVVVGAVVVAILFFFGPALTRYMLEWERIKDAEEKARTEKWLERERERAEAKGCWLSVCGYCGTTQEIPEGTVGIVQCPRGC